MKKPKKLRHTSGETSQETTSISLTELFMNNSNYKVVHPKDIKIGLEEVFAHKECKKELQSLLHFLKDPQKYYDFGATPHTKYLLVGDYGIGKKTLVCAIAKEAELPVIIIEPTFFCSIDVMEIHMIALHNEVTQLLQKYPNCILLFKNVEYWLSVDKASSIPGI